MKLDLPIQSSEETPRMKMSIDTFLGGVKRDIEIVEGRYESVYQILGEALQQAMTWAPAAVMNKQVPSAKKLYTLAIQLLSVCYATEKNFGTSTRD